jgi:hypothetical protein
MGWDCRTRGQVSAACRGVQGVNLIALRLRRGVLSQRRWPQMPRPPPPRTRSCVASRKRKRLDTASRRLRTRRPPATSVPVPRSGAAAAAQVALALTAHVYVASALSRIASRAKTTPRARLFEGEPGAISRKQWAPSDRSPLPQMTLESSQPRRVQHERVGRKIPAPSPQPGRFTLTPNRGRTCAADFTHEAQHDAVHPRITVSSMAKARLPVWQSSE